MGGLEGKPRRQISHGLTKSFISARATAPEITYLIRYHRWVLPTCHYPPTPSTNITAGDGTDDNGLGNVMRELELRRHEGVDAVIQTLHSLRARKDSGGQRREPNDIKTHYFESHLLLWCNKIICKTPSLIRRTRIATGSLLVFVSNKYFQ